MDILVNVSNQKLKIATNLKNLVAGTQEFVKFTFNLTSDWDNLMTFAQFQQNGVAYNVYLDENNSVYLPPEIGAGTCTLMLSGNHDNTIATTNYLTLIIDDNILISDINSTEISESLYTQLINKFNTLQESADAANTAAETANDAATRATSAADGAEKVNISAVPTETGAKITVTNKDGVTTSVDIDTLNDETLESFSAEAEQIKSELAELKDSKADKPVVPDIAPIFANNSWDTIAYVSKHLNPADYWNIGDVKNLNINGVDIPIVIIGFNHDKVADSAKSTYGKSVAGMTLQIGANRKTVPDMTLDSILNSIVKPSYSNIELLSGYSNETIGYVEVTNPSEFTALLNNFGNPGDKLKFSFDAFDTGWSIDGTVGYTGDGYGDSGSDGTLAFRLFTVIFNENIENKYLSSGDYFEITVENFYADSINCGWQCPNAKSTSSPSASAYWGDSYTRNQLKTLLNETEVSSNVVPVKKYTSKFYNVANMYAAPEITEDNVFLLSEYEVFGDTLYSPFKEGDHYEYYKDGNSKFSWSNSAIQDVVHKGYREFSWLRSAVASKVSSTNPVAPYNCAVLNEVNRYPDDVQGGLSVNYQPDNNTRYFSQNVVYIADSAAGKGDGSSYGNRMGNNSSYQDEVDSAYKGSALYRAFEQLQETGGTIVVCGDLTLNRADALRDGAAEFQLPENKHNLIRITGYIDSTGNNLSNIILDKSKYNVNLSIKGMTIWDNLKFYIKSIKQLILNRVSAGDATFMFECNGYKTVFGYGIKIDKQTSNNPLPTICGFGRYGSTSQTEALKSNQLKYGSVTVKSGDWEEICGTIFQALVTTKNGVSTYYKYSAGSAQINFVGGSVKYISGGRSAQSGSNNSVFYGNININILSNNFTTLAFPNTQVVKYNGYGGQVLVNVVGIKSFNSNTVITGRSTTNSSEDFYLKSSYEIPVTVLDYSPASGFETQPVVANLTPTYNESFFYGKILPCFCL